MLSCTPGNPPFWNVQRRGFSREGQFCSKKCLFSYVGTPEPDLPFPLPVLPVRSRNVKRTGSIRPQKGHCRPTQLLTRSGRVRAWDQEPYPR